MSRLSGGAGGGIAGLESGSPGAGWGAAGLDPGGLDSGREAARADPRSPGAGREAARLGSGSLAPRLRFRAPTAGCPGIVGRISRGTIGLRSGGNPSGPEFRRSAAGALLGPGFAPLPFASFPAAWWLGGCDGSASPSATGGSSESVTLTSVFAPQSLQYTVAVMPDDGRSKRSPGTENRVPQALHLIEKGIGTLSHSCCAARGSQMKRALPRPILNRRIAPR